MSTSIAANTELSHCFASLINYFPNKPNPTNYVLLNCAYECKILFLSIASKGVRGQLPYSFNQGVTYKDAWVDIDVGSKLLRRIAKMAPRIGAFGGDSYLVAGTDELASNVTLFQVAMNVNDIVTFGAKPLFFLDYFATSHWTAEMCDFYVATEYDLSGFAIGIVKKDSVINGKNILAGDVLIGQPSNGVHSNGFWPKVAFYLISNFLVKTLHWIKLQVLDIISKGGEKGILHIVGSGFTDNILWVFPKGLGVVRRIEDSEMR
ncbi:hypothetical protein CUMW_261050 [Citrus unshiu]|uniref:PurM-like N-terminal domain-containing protein n=1 Tax=Citrus unshiu TaxID=55188 RepID=A0A2H5QTW4_CITUN|nr:hypothetical protein CUMW_261050 [Citrus unshiu]